jgi:hypothetical protein
MNRQVQVDLETLRAVIPALERLETEWNDARVSVAARSRGYFTPDEDDRVRQMLLAYRNYRFALYEIIYRGYEYPRIQEPERQLMVFLLAFGAALTIYAKSLKLIQAYEREPLIRKKLNEADAKFELEPDFFEELLRGYSSPGNYRGLAKATWFWLNHRRAVQKLAASSPDDWKWLLELILHQRGIVRRRLLHVLACRLRYDWRAFARTVLQPVRDTRYSIRSQIAGACSQLRTTLHYDPALKPDVLARLHPHLRPGDVLLIRSEKKLTSAILPGFWAHAALFIDGAAGLESIGLAAQPMVARHRAGLLRQDAGRGCVVEAVSPRVQVTSLESALFADHVAVLRPRLGAEDLRAGLAEAFHHIDKPYDYEFDFNVSTRIVCTELIYRSFHKRGPIAFTLVKRLGRYTLSGDDIMNQWLDSLQSPARPATAGFDLVTLVLKLDHGRAEFFEGPPALDALQRIRGGWRPASQAPPRSRERHQDDA